MVGTTPYLQSGSYKLVVSTSWKLASYIKMASAATAKHLQRLNVSTVRNDGEVSQDTVAIPYVLDL